MSNSRRQIRTRLPFTLHAAYLCSRVMSAQQSLFFILTGLGLTATKNYTLHLLLFPGASQLPLPPRCPLNPCCKRFNMELFSLQGHPRELSDVQEHRPSSPGRLLSPEPSCRLSRLDPYCQNDTSSCKDVTGGFQKAAVLVRERGDAPDMATSQPQP